MADSHDPQMNLLKRALRSISATIASACLLAFAIWHISTALVSNEVRVRGAFQGRRTVVITDRHPDFYWHLFFPYAIIACCAVLVIVGLIVEKGKDDRLRQLVSCHSRHCRSHPGDPP